MRHRLFACLMLAVLLVSAGCATSSPSDSGETPVPTETSAPGGVPNAPGEMVPRPGLYEVEGVRVRALGILDYRDLEGGFWAVVDAANARDATDAKVVAVIANATDLKVDLDALKGRYVSVEGERLEGVSIRQAGPEIQASSIAELTGAPTGAE